MCLSADAYVTAVVYERLVKRGVDPARAEGVARKVGRAYRLKRQQASARRHSAAQSDYLLDRVDIRVPDEPRSA
jgi:hypothetical protein